MMDCLGQSAIERSFWIRVNTNVLKYYPELCVGRTSLAEYLNIFEHISFWWCILCHTTCTNCKSHFPPHYHCCLVVYQILLVHQVIFCWLTFVPRISKIHPVVQSSQLYKDVERLLDDFIHRNCWISISTFRFHTTESILSIAEL